MLWTCLELLRFHAVPSEQVGQGQCAYHTCSHSSHAVEPQQALVPHIVATCPCWMHVFSTSLAVLALLLATEHLGEGILGTSAIGAADVAMGQMGDRCSGSSINMLAGCITQCLLAPVVEAVPAQTHPHVRSYSTCQRGSYNGVGTADLGPGNGQVIGCDASLQQYITNEKDSFADTRLSTNTLSLSKCL